MRWWRLATALVTLVPVACGRDRPVRDYTDMNPDETAPSTVTAPVTTLPTTTTLPLGEQVTTVEAAQRLLDLFARLDGDAVRMLLQKGTPDAEFDQALQAVYVGQELDAARARFARETGRQFFGYARPQPDIVFRAREVIDARRTPCVVVAGTADLRKRYTNPVPTVEGIFVMVMQQGIIPTGGNPTRWRLLVVGEPADGTDVLGICPGL